MRRCYLAVVYLLLATACAPDNDAFSTPAPAHQPIRDSAPYVCELIPQQAFRMVSGAAGALTGQTRGSEESGECWAPDTAPHPLEVGWLQVGGGTSQEHLDYVIKGRRQLYSRHGGVKIPAELGDGLAAYLTNSPLADQPYRISAKFRCGGRDRMVDIFLAEVAEGRDGIRDLIELMRIAQKRYGELHGCVPGA